MFCRPGVDAVIGDSEARTRAATRFGAQPCRPRPSGKAAERQRRPGRAHGGRGFEPGRPRRQRGHPGSPVVPAPGDSEGPRRRCAVPRPAHPRDHEPGDGLWRRDLGRGGRVSRRERRRPCFDDVRRRSRSGHPAFLIAGPQPARGGNAGGPCGRRRRRPVRPWARRGSGERVSPDPGGPAAKPPAAESPVSTPPPVVSPPAEEAPPAETPTPATAKAKPKATKSPPTAKPPRPNPPPAGRRTGRGTPAPARQRRRGPNTRLGRRGRGTASPLSDRRQRRRQDRRLPGPPARTRGVRGRRRSARGLRGRARARAHPTTRRCWRRSRRCRLPDRAVTCWSTASSAGGTASSTRSPRR